jgi:hypothetical protein
MRYEVHMRFFISVSLLAIVSGCHFVLNLDSLSYLDAGLVITDGSTGSDAETLDGAVLVDSGSQDAGVTGMDACTPETEEEYCRAHLLCNLPTEPNRCNEIPKSCGTLRATASVCGKTVVAGDYGRLCLRKQQSLYSPVTYELAAPDAGWEILTFTSADLTYAGHCNNIDALVTTTSGLVAAIPYTGTPRRTYTAQLPSPLYGISYCSHDNKAYVVGQDGFRSCTYGADGGSEMSCETINLPLTPQKCTSVSSACDYGVGVWILCDQTVCFWNGTDFKCLPLNFAPVSIANNPGSPTSAWLAGNGFVGTISVDPTADAGLSSPQYKGLEGSYTAAIPYRTADLAFVAGKGTLRSCEIRQINGIVCENNLLPTALQDTEFLGMSLQNTTAPYNVVLAGPTAIEIAK